MVMNGFYVYVKPESVDNSGLGIIIKRSREAKVVKRLSINVLQDICKVGIISQRLFSQFVILLKLILPKLFFFIKF